MFQVSTARRIVVTIFATVVASLLGLFASAVSADTLTVPVDIVLGDQAYADNAIGGGITVLTNGSDGGQWDTGVGAPTNPTNVPYVAVLFGSTKTFNRLMFGDLGGLYTAQGKTFEVATVSNPDPAVNADWTPITGGVITSNPTQTSFDFSGHSYTTTGVRVLFTDTSNTPDKKARPHEIWVWDNWSPSDNLARTASSYVNTTPAGYNTINDEDLTDQAYGGSTILSGPDMGDHYQGYMWSTPQTIRGVLLAGGSSGEILDTFHLEYLDSSDNWVDVPGASFAGDTNYLNNITFAPIVTTGLRVVVSLDKNPGDGPGDGLDRISEFAVFSLPEPASMSLVAVGGLMLLKRRR